MSTRSTLWTGVKHGESNVVYLEEEMISETTQLIVCGERARFDVTAVAGSVSLAVTLASDVLDAIARLHAEKRFPHQRPQ